MLSGEPFFGQTAGKAIKIAQTDVKYIKKRVKNPR